MRVKKDYEKDYEKDHIDACLFLPGFGSLVRRAARFDLCPRICDDGVEAVVEQAGYHARDEPPTRAKSTGKGRGRYGNQ